MKRTEALVYSPAIIAIVIAVASIATFESGSVAPSGFDTPRSVVAPAPQGDVPNLGEITVTASPIATAADLSKIADSARI
jgi:hypothetical protein